MNNEIIGGIIAGIITAILIWLGGQLLIKVILPWFETKMFKGIKIDGTWLHIGKHLDDNEESIFEDKLEIKQSGYTISGFYTCRNERKAGVLTTEYLMSGHIQDSYVLITYKRKDNIGTGIGCFLLKIIGNADMLEGGVSFIELRTTNVLSLGDIIFRKTL